MWMLTLKCHAWIRKMTKDLISYDLDIKIIKEEIRAIHRKLDQIIEGPAFKSTLSHIGGLSAKTDENLKSLNNMLLQVKGIVSQVNTLRGRKSDWDGTEINGHKNQIKLIAERHE